MKNFNPWDGLLSSFSRMRLIPKFCLLFLLVWVFPMIFTSSLIYCKITDNLIKSQTELAKQGHQQVQSFLAYRMDRIFLISSIIAMDTTLNGILTRDPGTYTHTQQMKDLNTIRIYLDQFQSTRNSYDSLRLYVPGGRIYSDENKLIFNLDKVKNTLWYKNSFADWGWITYNPPGLMDTPNVLSVVRPIRDLDHYRMMVGAVRIDIPLKEIENMLSRANIAPGCLTYLVTGDGTPVGASSPDLLESYGLTRDQISRADAGGAFVPMRQRGDKVWVYTSNITDIGWTLITVLPEKKIAVGIRAVQWQYITAISLLFLAVILINVPIFNSITRRLKQLVQRMKLVQEGDLNANLHPKNHDEIGQLMDDFNFMLERIKELMAQQYALGQELRTADLKALQSQINPHFLYNTLEMVGWLAQEETPRVVQSVMKTLAQFYRLSLNKGRDITTIENELELLRSYMYIQQLRFHNSIALLIDVADIRNFSLPKITLQPIVENAIIHGILERPGKSGVVEIRGHMTPEGMIELTIADNGVGMNAEQLENLRAGRSVSSEGSGYGLDNIEKRICLFFGIENGLFFESEPNVGTRVLLRIPPVPYTGDE